MTTIWQRIETDIAIVEGDISPVFTAVKNFLMTLTEDEIAAAIPILEKWAATVLTPESWGALFTPSAWPGLIEAIVSAAAPELTSSALKIAGPEITLAASTVLTAIQAKVSSAVTGALAPAAPAS